MKAAKLFENLMGGGGQGGSGGGGGSDRGGEDAGLLHGEC